MTVRFGSRGRTRRRRLRTVGTLTVALAVALAVGSRIARGDDGPFETVSGQSFEIRSGRSQDVAFAGVALRNTSDRPARVTSLALRTGDLYVVRGRPSPPGSGLVFGEVLVAQGAPALLATYTLGWPPVLVGNSFTPFQPFTVEPGNEVQLLMQVNRTGQDPVEVQGLEVSYRSHGARHGQLVPLDLRLVEPG